MACDGRVLVVGPTPGAVAATLDDLGVTALAATDLDEARPLLDDHPVDCVVTELRFAETSPDSSDASADVLSRQFLDALREWDPTLPVVVYTDVGLASLDATALVGATTCVPRGDDDAETRLQEWVERAVDARTRQRDRLAGVVHDLRTPLRAANVSLARLRREFDPDTDTGAGDHLGDLAATHERLGALLDDLDSLLDAGRPVVDADRRKLRRLFENCVANAIEHGGGDEGADDLRVEVGATAGGFYVADDGPGIPEAVREVVFERGYSTVDRTGYGLAIVAELAAAHGWSVEATESDSGGARIEVRT